MYTYMKLTVSFLLLATVGFSLANGAVYAPAAGEPGSTAIHKDSAVFVITSYSIHYTKLYENWLYNSEKSFKRLGFWRCSEKRTSDHNWNQK